MRYARRRRIDHDRCVDFYLRDDGGAEARLLAEWLSAHPEAARRARREAMARQQIQARFAPVLDEPIPPRLLGHFRSPAARWPARLALVTSLLLATSSGWALGHWTAGGRQPAAFGQRVLRLAHQRPTPAPQPAAAVARGARPTHPDLSAAGYALAATHTISRGGAPIRVYVYRRPSGAEVRIYAETRPAHPNPAPRVFSRDGVALARWRRGQTDYALVGDLPKRELGRLARDAARATARKPPRLAVPLARGDPDTVAAPATQTVSPAKGTM